MTDSDVMQDFFDTFHVTNALNAIVHVENFLAGRHGLAELAPKPDSDPRHILSCIKKVHDGIGFRLFRDFITLKDVAPGEGLDDVWAHWCQSPVALHTADYPAGTIPLWSNGKNTVFCRIVKDGRGFDAADFGVT